jgi:hypothetical protein
MLNKIALQELQYLQQGGSTICGLAVLPLRRAGLITVDSPQPFSNHCCPGISVTLTKKGQRFKCPA